MGGVGVTQRTQRYAKGAEARGDAAKLLLLQKNQLAGASICL